MRADAIILLAALVAACGGPGPGLDGGRFEDPDAGALPDAGAEQPWPEVPSAPAPEVLARGLRSPCGLTVAPGVLYVAEEGGGRVLALPLDGGAPGEVAAGLGAPHLLARDGEALFLSERDGGSVVRLYQGTSQVLATGQVSPGRVRVAGGYVYWMDEGTGAADGALRRVPTEGGAPETLAAGLTGPRGLAVSEGRCYFAESGARKVGFAPLDGGAPTRLSDPFGYPFDIAVSPAAGEVLWTSPGARGGGWIHRANLELTSDALVSFSPPGPSWMALAQTRVVWSTGQTLSWAPRKGGWYEDLVVETEVCDFVLAGRHLYWTERPTGRVLHQLIF